MSMNIILTHIPNAGEKTTRLNLEPMTSLEVYNFMHSIQHYNPQLVSLKVYNFMHSIQHYNPQYDNDNNCSCGFNIYYKGVAFRVIPYDIPKKWHKKSGDNELIIEMIPLYRHRCVSSQANYHCPTCLASGECKSPFIKLSIGAFLFPGKYKTER